MNDRYRGFEGVVFLFIIGMIGYLINIVNIGYFIYVYFKDGVEFTAFTISLLLVQLVGLFVPWIGGFIGWIALFF